MATSTALAGGALRMTAAGIAAAVGGAVVAGSPGTAVSGVSTDSRTISAGALFVALSGEKFDGHDFVVGAFARGAAAALVDVERIEGLRTLGTLIGVESRDLLPALASLARAHRDGVSIPVVGITGSAGKTTAKEMTAAVLSGAGRKVLKTEGNLNNRIGVPLTVMSIGPEHGAAVVEMGISLPGEMKELVRAARPTVRVLLVAGIGHVEFLKDAKSVAREKACIWDGVADGDVGIWNADDPLVAAEAALRATTMKMISFGRSPKADVQATLVTRTGIGRMTVEMSLMGKGLVVELNATGEHMVMNALAAAAAGVAIGVEAPEIVAGLESRFVPVPGRGDVIPLAGDVILIDDTYNSNPTSATAALASLAATRSAGRTRVLAALGDMLELGPAGPGEHHRLGETAARLALDGLYTFGPLSEGTAAAFPGARAFATRKDLADAVLADLAAGDAILVKGSRGMKMDEVASLIAAGRGTA